MESIRMSGTRTNELAGGNDKILQSSNHSSSKTRPVTALSNGRFQEYSQNDMRNLNFKKRDHHTITIGRRNKDHFSLGNKESQSKHHGESAPARFQRSQSQSIKRPMSASSRLQSNTADNDASDEGKLRAATAVPPRYFINLHETVLQRYKALGYLSENRFKKMNKQGDLPVRLAGGESRKVKWEVELKDLSADETADLLGILMEGSWDRSETNRVMSAKAIEELLPIAATNGGLMLALVPPERDGFNQLPVPEVVKQMSRGLNTFQPGLIGLMLIILRKFLDAHESVADELLPFCRKLLPVLGIYIYSNICLEVPPRGDLLPVNKVVSVSGYSARDAGKGHLNKKSWGLRGKSPVLLGAMPLMAKKERLTKLIEDVVDRIINGATDKNEAIRLVKLSIPTYAAV